METATDTSGFRARGEGVVKTRRTREQLIRVFFGGNALVAIVVLGLITIFLFREGFGFFGQNLTNLRLYRESGLEYVDIIRGQARGHTALVRGLNSIRARQFERLQDAGRSPEQILAALAPFDQFLESFSTSGEDLNGIVSDLGEQASALNAELSAQAELLVARENLAQRGGAPGIEIKPVDRAGQLALLRTGGESFSPLSAALTAEVQRLLHAAPTMPDPASQRAFEAWQEKASAYVAGLPRTTAQLRAWNPDKPVTWYRGISSFLFGRDWITASFWQDWYGILPLLTGSIMVSVVALTIAVPLSVAAAIYVSEIATVREKKVIKPYIEFIAAIPSVVLGFFGIAVVGEAIRAASRSEWLSWVSFFPLSERLNIFTAGCLLALMAVPTIFTLAEDALRNVPRGFKEASYALGANRLQTIGRVLIPSSLSGIVSAILLGLGRVIGETMVVLLCAGNRIEIPDFTEGLGAFFQPVHTMTGIIAQEMGEVVRGSMHYRALFMVGLVLFTITLCINYLAQKLVARYRMNIG